MKKPPANQWNDEPPSRWSLCGLAVVVLIIIIIALSMGCAMKDSTASHNSVSLTVNILTP